VAFDDGIGPSQWVEKIISAEYAGMGATPSPNCDEEDKAALLALMKSIGQPIPADANTNGVSNQFRLSNIICGISTSDCEILSWSRTCGT